MSYVVLFAAVYEIVYRIISPITGLGVSTDLDIFAKFNVADASLGDITHVAVTGMVDIPSFQVHSTCIVAIFVLSVLSEISAPVLSKMDEPE